MKKLIQYGRRNKSLAKAVYIDDINMDNSILVDVREKDEIKAARIKDIVYTKDASKIRDIAENNPDKKVVIHCKRGGRAATFGTRLVEMGCENVYFFDDSFSKFYEKFEIVGDDKDCLRNIE